MKKILLILLVCVSSFSFSQELEINNSGTSTNIGGNVYVEDTLFANKIDSSLVQRISQIQIDSKAFANAYLPSDSTPSTNCVLADTWYFVQGNFINQKSNEFALVNDTLVYIGTDSVGALVMYNASVSCTKNGSTITFGFSSNGDPYPMTTRSVDLDIGSKASVTKFFTKPYYENEKVKFVVKSSVASNVVTITDANLYFEEKRKL